MLATSMRGPTWPARLSFIAAGLFTMASGGTNLIYGWSKGTDTGSSLVWAAVSIGVSIIFALSWPALHHLARSTTMGSGRDGARRSRHHRHAIQVSAALGSAMGGRMNAAVERK